MLMDVKAILLANKKDTDGLTKKQALDVLMFGATGPWDDSTIKLYEDGDARVIKPTYQGAIARDRGWKRAETRVKSHFTPERA